MQVQVILTMKKKNLTLCPFYLFFFLVILLLLLQTIWISRWFLEAFILKKNLQKQVNEL